MKVLAPTLVGGTKVRATEAVLRAGNPNMEWRSSRVTHRAAKLATFTEPSIVIRSCRSHGEPRCCKLVFIADRAGSHDNYGLRALHIGAYRRQI